MARTVKIKVYKYAELSKAAQTRAREWFRTLDMGHESWSEPVTADLKTIAALMGWTVTDTAFSGFCCQGDGAQFTGTWKANDVQDVPALEAHAPASASERNATLARIMEAIAALAKEAPDTSALVERNSGHYSHSNATRFDTDDMTPVQLDTLREQSRALMDWYYRELETAHDWENADEQVAETIEANEYEFKANGNRFEA